MIDQIMLKKAKNYVEIKKVPTFVAAITVDNQMHWSSAGTAIK